MIQWTLKHDLSLVTEPGDAHFIKLDIALPASCSLTE